MIRAISVSIFCWMLLVNPLSAQHHFDVVLDWQRNSSGAFFFEKGVASATHSGLQDYFEHFRLSGQNNDVIAVLTEQEEEIVRDIPDSIMNRHDIASDYELDYGVRMLRKTHEGYVRLFPIRKDKATGAYYRLVSFTIEAFEAHTARKAGRREYAENSRLSEGNWFKIGVDTTGIFRMDYDDLTALGLGNNIESSKLKLYGYGKGMLPEKVSDSRPDDLPEIPIQVIDGGDGIINQGDYIVFYAEDTDKWEYNAEANRYQHQRHVYADTNYYFLTVSGGAGKRIEETDPVSEEATYISDSYDHLIHHEKDEHSLINSGRRLMGEVFDIETVYDFTYTVPDLIQSEPVKMQTRLVARSTQTTSFTINAGNTFENISMPAISLSENSKYAQEQLRSFTFDVSKNPWEVTFTYNKTNNSSIGWLDYFSMHLRRKNKFLNGQSLFRDARSLEEPIVEYRLAENVASLQVWDVTDLHEISLMPLQNSQNQSTFKAGGETLREFVAFDGSHYLEPIPIGKVNNQNLHGISGNTNYIVITPAFLQEQAARLADFHRSKNGLNTKVVLLNQIYNEFSSGVQDISAIRDFLKLVYDKESTNGGLQYVLLFGDGSFDHKDIIEENTNIVPTYQTPNSLHPVNSYTTDDFFGFLDEGEGDFAVDALDIGIGRLPISTREEARRAVDKIMHYASGDEEVMKPWRNMIAFIADDEDGNSHLNQANTLAEYVTDNYPDYNVDKIFFDAYKQVSTPGGKRYPDVTESINTRVESGALFVNYTGHGGEVGLAHERVLGIPDIENWSNYDRLPVFVTATCEFSRFDDPDRTSAGEHVFKHRNGGGIALFTTTRATYGNPNFSLNQSFYRHALRDLDGETPRMGDLIRLSKLDVGSTENAMKFILLGDPALKIAYPEKEARITHINDKDIQYGGDTLKALGEIQISGEIVHSGGDIDESFDGVVFSKIFDKKETVTTLGNDQGSHPADFEVRKSVLYNGKAIVENGKFSFRFIVPKDIDYNLGYGKISLYTAGEGIDANGSYNDVVIGGFSESSQQDNEGPVIELFINDPEFEDGGITGPNPVLYASIYDESGINTTGSGIGHDLVAYINNTNDVKVLNDFYETELNTYKKGSVRFPFFDVEEGEHTLYLKAWDVFNNSATASVDFKVVGKDKLEIGRLKNYPNPVTDYTHFVFEHNQKNQELILELEIFDTYGNRVFSESKQVYADGGNKTEPITWYGENSSGSPLKKGLYIYTLKVKTEGELVDSHTNKLLLIK
ncbi:MAG: type IX secretion system sortase PorU [Bacteroidota bacterium]